MASFPARPRMRVVRHGTAAAATAMALTSLIAPPALSAPVEPGAVFAIGDSVMLGAQPCLHSRGYRVDAKGSRQARGVAAELASARSLPRQIVIHTGTNGGAGRADIRQIVRAVGPLHEIVFLTVQLPDGTTRYTFEGSTNRAIEAIAAKYPNVHVADWNAASAQHPGWTWGDGIHLTPAGCRGYTRMVARAVRDAVWLPNPYFPMRPR